MGEGFEINMFNFEDVTHFCLDPPEPLSSLSRQSILLTKIAVMQ